MCGADIERTEKLKSEIHTKSIEESKDSSKRMLNEDIEIPKLIQTNLIEIVNLEKAHENQIDIKIKKNKLQQIIDDMSEGGQLMEFGIVDFVK